MVKLINMEKRSEHYGDTQKWIEKVIDSCETYHQTNVAGRLISNFRMKLLSDKDYHLKYHYTVILPLEDRLSDRRSTLIISHP